LGPEEAGFGALRGVWYAGGMGDVAAFRWDVDDLEREVSAPLRAKPLVRRVQAVWREDDGLFRTAIGRWAVTVAAVPPRSGPPRSAVWEWTAFAAGGPPLPRALGCKGFGSREAAQQDAEATLARQV
jgi:hypothetical protein